MLPITTILPSENVFLDLELTSKKRLFEYVGLWLENNYEIARDVVYDALFERERTGSTGIGCGIALPHGRIHGLKEAVGMFVRLKNPISFDAIDGLPVTCTFILLVPMRANAQHLGYLSALAQRFSDYGLREALMNTQDVETAYRLLTETAPV